LAVNVHSGKPTCVHPLTLLWTALPCRPQRCPARLCRLTSATASPAGIVLLVDGEGYLSCLEVYSIGDEPVRRIPAAEQINVSPQRV